VYLVLSHKQPQQVVRLVRRLRPEGSDSHVILHHDESVSYFDPALLRGVGNVHRIPSQPVTWGDFSHVEAILRGLRWVRNHLDFDWVVLLSGQDYPIHPLPEVEEFLSATEFDGFVKGSPVGWGADADREGMRRYFYRYYRVPLPAFLSPPFEGEHRPAARMARKMRDAQALFSVKTAPSGGYFGLRRFRHGFSTTFPCYRGSTWFTISPECVDSVESFLRENPWYVRHYRRTRSAAESFFITILLNDPRLNLSLDHLRYIRFRGNSPNPKILTMRDLEAVLSSGKHFARKFDIDVDAAVLDQLDERVHGLRKRGRRSSRSRRSRNSGSAGQESIRE
jgi:hypothetical protein